jgi:hypothetical protein
VSFEATSGEFTGENQESRYCSKCKVVTMHRERKWESSCGGYEDYKYTCTVCGTSHWVDGCDS